MTGLIVFLSLWFLAGATVLTWWVLIDRALDRVNAAKVRARRRKQLDAAIAAALRDAGVTK